MGKSIAAATVYPTLEALLAAVRDCRVCEAHLPPSRECAVLWLDHLLARLPRIEVTLRIGQYAQRHFLGSRRKPSLAETVKAWREYASQYIPLPHPSPRNQPWFKYHPWFERQLVPVLRARINALCSR